MCNAIDNNENPWGSYYEMAAPLIHFTLGAATTYTAIALNRMFKPNPGETRWDMLGRWLKKIPYVEEELNKKLRPECEKFRQKVLKSWETFGDPVREIPNEGWEVKKIEDLLIFYQLITDIPLQDEHFSGAVYPNALTGQKTMPEITHAKEESLEADLEYLFALAATYAKYWNPLHADLFPIGDFLQYQVSAMIAEMFGGKPDEVAGLSTDGGTDSLMTAMRMYRNWGMATKGHKLGEGVIIASRSVHAAVNKAEQDFGCELVYVKCDEHGVVDLKHIEKLLKRYGSRVVAMIGSTPSYPTGTIDDIAAMAKLAKEYNIGLHVDACLGGFIVNNLDSHGYDTNYLAIDGVTSLSCDCHKNGYAPKGVSVLIAKHLAGRHPILYTGYGYLNWSGGLYATKSRRGSEGITELLCAFVALLRIGKQGFRENAQKIHGTVEMLAERIREEFKDRIEILGQHEANVIAFRVLGMPKGATYALAHEMKERGFSLNNIHLGNEGTHWCVTRRFAEDLEGVDKFMKALEESYSAIKVMDSEKYPGDAGIYGQIEDCERPKVKKMGVIEWVEMMLLGAAATKEASLFYCAAANNPYMKMGVEERGVWRESGGKRKEK